ncbi:MAG: MBL fold metallo-hydrolase [Oscillospiraceae bacterium]|nr:MBL fold metallo-hydrolase [Oscillospiraceae bacterium]
MAKDRSWMNNYHSDFTGFELVTGNTYTTVLSAAGFESRILMYRLPNNGAVIIDSGVFYSPAMFQWLEDNHITVRAVISSHLHWDHIFNNQRLHDIYGCPVYVAQSDFDKAITGWKPEPGLYTYLPDNATVQVDGFDFPTFLTPGHTPGHHAIVTPDRVCHLGDAALSLNQLAISKLPYLEDIDQAVYTMAQIGTSDYDYYCFSHNAVVPHSEIADVIRANIQKELDLYDFCLNLVTGPGELEDYVMQFMPRLGITKPDLLSDHGWQHTCRKRLLELVTSGELVLEGSIIRPAERHPFK